jgi:hypothetical protein
VPEKVSNVTVALDGYAWHADAACADSADPDAWFPEGSSADREEHTRPRAMEAFLTCVGCPVRRQCLAEALTSWIVPMGPGGASPGHRIEVKAAGIWGGTDDRERLAVAHLPRAEAIDKLEAELPERDRVRIAAFAARYPRRGGRQNRAAGRVWARLDAMGELGGGGRVDGFVRSSPLRATEGSIQAVRHPARPVAK